MHLFADYVQPLTSWLHTHPSWALLLTGLISFAESLAIIGSLIPGSLTMTAIGILAGSGVMRIDLTLCSAALGALAGDSASYLLGATFSDRLTLIWPFSRYPKLFDYGKNFFIQHGGKSVLIGRFVGPLRSIIPVIAGMMHMPRSHFFLANLLSAIGWSILYIMPGFLIGAASSQLSTDSARRLLCFILILLIAAWLVSQCVRRLAQSINRWYGVHLNTLWIWSKNHPRFKRLFATLAAEEENNNSFTVALVIAWLVCLTIFIMITTLVIQGIWVSIINNPVSFFLQSLRTELFDVFFILLNFIISPISLIGIFLVIVFAAVYARDWRILRYWVSLACVTEALTILLTSCIDIPNPTNLFQIKATATFPVINLTWATSLFNFLIYYLIGYHRSELTTMLRAILTVVLIFAGFSIIYLGDNWMTSVLGAYFLGLTISLVHWIFYRRKNPPPHRIGLVIILSCSLLLITASIEYLLHFETIVNRHAPKPQQHVLTEDAWWHQHEPVLPIYTKNRVGNSIGLFNIQYTGSIHQLEHQLADYGWKKQSSSLIYSLLIRAGGQHSADTLPLMEQLHLNKKPKLIMTYRAVQDDKLFILRLWGSNYHLEEHQEPIWLGSIILMGEKSTPPQPVGKQNTQSHQNLFGPMLPALKHYRIVSITIKNPRIKSRSHMIPSDLLLIRGL